MWQLLHTSKTAELDLTISTRELIEDTTRSLLYTAGGMWLIVQVIMTAFWTGVFDRHSWPITILYALLSALVLFLLPRFLRLSQIIWLAGIGLLITYALLTFNQVEIALLYPLLPFLAMVLTHWRVSALFMVAIALLLNWLHTGTASLLPISAGESYTILLLSAVMAIVARSSSHITSTTIQWALTSFALSQKATDEARQHRAELAELYKNQDHAYYLLERANAALVVARNMAEEAERFKTEFVTNVSHELRTPLNLIVGFTEMMVTSPENYENIRLPKAYRGDLYSVYHSAQHLLALVDDVLDLARIEVGKIALIREQIDLYSLVMETATIVRDYISSKGLELRFEVEDALPPLWIDRVRIRQVLLNLLVNAARHTEEGMITIEAKRENGEVTVRVTDTGPGISERDLGKIFEEFHTSERHVTEWHSGTGLGLPISRKFVELHSGRIGVESRLGEGASFWFTLPVADQGPIEQTAGRRFQPPVQLYQWEPILVLVNGDRAVSSLLGRHLSGYRIVDAPTVEEGIALAREMQAVALLLPPDAPALPSLHDLLVIRCPLPDAEDAANELGVEEILVKPVSRQELLAVVDRLARPLHKVLIVDDNPEVVQLFRRILRARIPIDRCREAYGGDEALQAMREEKPDLLILDLVMPGIDGRMLLAQMQSDPELAGIPVILVTAQGQEHMRARLPGAIQIEQHGGFEVGQIVSCLVAVCNVMAPGWQRLTPIGTTRAVDRAGSPA
jgi:signal transduction histidine kinase/CheY-like chemotaxis protein